MQREDNHSTARYNRGDYLSPEILGEEGCTSWPPRQAGVRWESGPTGALLPPVLQQARENNLIYR